MPDVEIAAAPVRVDIEIVLQPLRIVGADNDHRLIGPVVFRVREGISRDELKSSRKPPPQFGCERVVTRVARALEQVDAGKARNRPRCRMTQHRKRDRKSTRLNSSHGYISYAVFCLKKKTRI